MDTIRIQDLKSLPDAARSFLERNADKRVFAFYGDLGAGKTTFIKALCNELNVIDIVSSPSFSIINEYQNEKGMRIYHMDFYRIKDLDEALEIGLEDYFSTNDYCFIEWPEKIDELLPNQTTFVKIVQSQNNSRVLEIF
ncbi:MAG: tRNA (adenosine(37)-N6)-threonylcarbamoyltransferase complex ATPase subunit type 1 TsaE [Bacteroidales bacterium]|nr:tRNA (adenosine(37)-N6)-threonylcarbamoyltransferase complex ATPase subunit type 1 TsaE [Bacteroidales bacterium]